MAKSQQSFNKKEKEKKRRKKKQEKKERREQRKLEKAENGAKSFEDMLMYVDEDGNLTPTPPDPTKKKKEIKLENIVLGAAPIDNTPVETVREGQVKFFNDEKGYGFINDKATRESILSNKDVRSFDDTSPLIGSLSKLTSSYFSNPCSIFVIRYSKYLPLRNVKCNKKSKRNIRKIGN